MQSISTTGATIQLSENGNEVVLETPDQSSQYTFIKYVEGNLIFNDEKTVLGMGLQNG